MRRLLLLCLLCLLALPSFAQSWPDLKMQPSYEGGGENDTAVVVGISEYYTLSAITGAVDNANDWYMYLSKVRGLPASNITLLRNERGVREAVLDAVTERVDQAGRSNGTFWFIFVGHGAPFVDGEGKSDGILVGADAQALAKSLSTRGIRQSELFAAINKGRQKQSVVFLDACFSGKGSDGTTLVKDLQPLVVEPDLVTGNAVVLTAAKSNEFAGPLPGAERPAFSYLALGALRGWGDKNGDGQVSAQEVKSYVASGISATVTDRS